MTDPFTTEERALLAPFFTNADCPVFALRNLPQVVAGALFARYSRSAKSLRRLFLDEFAGDLDPAALTTADLVDSAHAEGVYSRVFDEYGDDSVAQLGSAHLAVEQCSNVMTKVLEWGRLASYLEQSTRYIAYTDRPDGRWRYHVPAEIVGTPLGIDYVDTLDTIFTIYTELVAVIVSYYEHRFPQSPDDPRSVWRSAIRARALDDLRGLLPAATTSNLGIHASAQAFEALLLRLNAHPLDEARAIGHMALDELRQVIPAFLVRVDRPDRGRAWSDYLARTEAATQALAHRIVGDGVPTAALAANGPRVELIDWDADGEAAVATAVLVPRTAQPESAVARAVAALSPGERGEVIRTYAGERTNRRHKPGRAFERTSYRFEIVCDYGAFRDLQRHRMATIEWQPLGIKLGYDVPASVAEVGRCADWDYVMSESARLHRALAEATGPAVAQYGACMAYKVRFTIDLNARAALHLIELRSSPQGHPAYRAVAHEMHRLISGVHPAIAATMTHVDRSDVDLERLAAERRAAVRRAERTSDRGDS